jgi:hypothetical protein
MCPKASNNLAERKNAGEKTTGSNYMLTIYLQAE